MIDIKTYKRSSFMVSRKFRQKMKTYFRKHKGGSYYFYKMDERYYSANEIKSLDA